jgi:hypothetical protein
MEQHCLTKRIFLAGTALTILTACSASAPADSPDGSFSPDGGQNDRMDLTFACGPKFCQKKAEVCVDTESDVIGAPGVFHCYPVPEPCHEAGPPSCQCLTLNPYDQCEQTGSGELQVTCPWYDGLPEGGVAICSF